MPPIRYTILPSPVGDLLLAGTDDALVGLWFGPHQGASGVQPGWREDRTRFGGEARQLEEYFAGTRTRFDVRMAPAGTAFQRRVWRALTEIPYGTTTTYGQLAARVGRPGAARAVGLANGRNPMAIIVPCHRVIGADGSLTGYGGGVDRKRLLLDLERGWRPLQLTFDAARRRAASAPSMSRATSSPAAATSSTAPLASPA